MPPENITLYRKGWNLNLSLLGLEVISDTGEARENEKLENLREVAFDPAPSGDAVMLSVYLNSGRILKFPDFPEKSRDSIKNRISELKEIKEKILLFGEDICLKKLFFQCEGGVCA